MTFSLVYQKTAWLRKAVLDLSSAGLPLLDAFRTLDWKKVREEMELLKPISI